MLQYLRFILKVIWNFGKCGCVTTGHNKKFQQHTKKKVSFSIVAFFLLFQDFFNGKLIDRNSTLFFLLDSPFMSLLLTPLSISPPTHFNIVSIIQTFNKPVKEISVSKYCLCKIIKWHEKQATVRLFTKFL